MINTVVNQFKVNKQFAKDFIAVAAAQSSGRKGGLLFKNSTEAAKVLREIVPKYWSRPQGASIDYLQVDIHWGWGLGAFLAVISITTGAFFVVEYKIFDNVNEFGEDRYSRWGY